MSDSRTAGGLDRLPWLIALSERTLRTARNNLIWSFSYNTVGVALAVAGLLHPLFGAVGMVASSLLVLTTGRQYCERFTDRLPVAILDCPVSLPRLIYYQLWHERTHSSSSARWLRERTKEVAASLRPAVAAGGGSG